MRQIEHGSDTLELVEKAQYAFHLNADETARASSYFNASDHSSGASGISSIKEWALDTGLHPLFKDITVHGWRSIQEVQHILNDSGVLVAMNHATQLDALIGAAGVTHLLDRDQRATRAILGSKRLKNVYKHPVVAGVTYAFRRTLSADMISIELDKGPVARKEYNVEPKLEVLHRLATPRNIIGIYPEATINPALVEARRGLGQFIATGEGYTLPVSTNVGRWMNMRDHSDVVPIAIASPIANADLYDAALCVNPEHPSQLASDVVMAKIAAMLPPDQQGFYRPFVSDIDPVWQDEQWSAVASRVQGVNMLIHEF